MRAVAAVPAIGLLAGSAFGLLVPDIPIAATCALLGSCAGLSVWTWRAGPPRALPWAIGLAFCFGGAVLAATDWQQAWRPPLRVVFDRLAREQRADAVAAGRFTPEDDTAFATVTGTLREDAAVTPSGVSLSVDVDGVAYVSPLDLSERGTRPLSGGILVTVVGSLAAERLDEWRAGRRVRVPVQLRRPARYLDPGVPDMERALAARGTSLVGSVKSGALVEILGRGSWLEELLGDFRLFCRRSIARAVGRWSSRSAAIVAAIVLGDRSGLDEDVQRRLQEAGTYHVIAISGGNIAILAGLMLGAFRIAGLLGPFAMVSAIGALVVYGKLVGGGASVDRATLMAVVYFAGRAMDQRGPPVNTLAFVASCLVATQPLSVVDPAFILTFGATLAILMVAPILTSRGMARGSALLVGVFAASVAAEVMLGPVMARVFSRVTMAGLALNFLAIPLMMLAQLAGMALVPVALISTQAASLVGYLAHLGATGLVRSTDPIRTVPFLTWRVAPPHWAALVTYYVALFLWWSTWRRKVEATGSGESGSARACRRTAAIVAVASAVWTCAEPWTLVAARGDRRLHITFLDVGQGDASLVRFPRGRTLLVDAGGLIGPASFDIGDRVVAPVLRVAGIRRLDYLALTHGDPDHIGGAPSMVREFRPLEIWEGVPVPRFEPLQTLQSEARRLGSRWTNLKTGDRFVVDEVEVLVRHPPIADWERQKVRNDDSIVLELRLRDVSVLLPGDIGKMVEPSLTPAESPAPLRVVKIPHHGSLTSSTAAWVRALAPRIAVVSAGRGNHFGHPAPQVVERYRSAGAEIFRTDRDGAVTVETDGFSAEVHTFTGRRLRLPAAPVYHEDTKHTKNTKGRKW